MALSLLLKQEMKADSTLKEDIVFTKIKDRSPWLVGDSTSRPFHSRTQADKAASIRNLAGHQGRQQEISGVSRTMN